MQKYILFFIILVSCSSVNSKLESISLPQYEVISFDAVEKEFIINTELPKNVAFQLKYWLSEKVKISGYEGSLIISIDRYEEIVSNIEGGKRVDASLSFKAIINTPSLSKAQTIEGSVSSYGTLTGNFCLAEFDTVIKNTQSDLILRLSRDLKSKI